jgi:hypothetical protein
VPVGYQSPYLVYNLTYHQLTPSIHPVFFSLYLAIAVLIIIFGFERQTLIKKNTTGSIGLIFSCLFSITNICFHKFWPL